MEGKIALSFNNGWECIISEPTKAVINIGLLKSRKDKLGLAQEILTRCWVSGEEKIKTTDGCLLEFSEYIDEVCNVKACESVRVDDKTLLVFEDGTELTLKAPSRVVLNDAMNKATKNPLGMTEHLIRECCESGDKDKVLADVGYLISASACMDDIMQKKTMTLKRL